MDKDKGMRKRDDHEGQGRHHVSSEKPESTIKGLPGFSCSQSNDVITGRCWILTWFSQVAHENVAPCGSDLVGQIVKVIMIFQIIFITNYKGRSSERKNIFFRALPELPLSPPPIRATCTIFIGCKK